MADRYQQFASSGAGRYFIKQFGLPNPVPLRRYEPGQPLAAGPVLMGSAPGGRLADGVHKALERARVTVREAPAASVDGARFGALIFDATGITDSTELRAVYDFFHPVIRSLTTSGRVLVLGTPPEATETARERTAQRALEGFVRSVAKEVGRGASAQLIYVEPGAENALDSTLRFFLSGKSAYVSGQVVRVTPAEPAEPADWDRPLDGKVALVTGAARGIGAAMATTLARDGAHVVCLDIPASGDELAQVANRVGGSALQLDLTAADAPRRLADHLTERHGGVDIVVHNAGITRDKTLGKMSGDVWDSVLDVNLSSQERINDVLLDDGVLRSGGRLVTVSSIAGIAGNFGQTNYATSKAGVIGLVQSMAPVVAGRGVTINAVAPGFIETRMTARVPVVTREAGRRMNSMSQGGLPLDVAEAVAWFAHPASGGLNGNVVRVCGQSLLGA